MENVISIIAVCVTLLLGLLGFVINSFIQRKNNSISVITKTRLVRREKSKELMSKVLFYSDVDYLDSLDEVGEKHPLYERSIPEASRTTGTS